MAARHTTPADGPWWIVLMDDGRYYPVRVWDDTIPQEVADANPGALSVFKPNEDEPIWKKRLI